jgi:uncharacterized DUF497 family protein
VEYNFEWDPVKAKINEKKHGVRFEEAAAVFKDPRALTLFDSKHDEKEERWITMGIIGTICICVVHHTFREEMKGNILIRIFSARKATKKEQQQYREE